MRERKDPSKTEKEPYRDERNLDGQRLTLKGLVDKRHTVRAGPRPQKVITHDFYISFGPSYIGKSGLRCYHYCVNMIDLSTGETVRLSMHRTYMLAYREVCFQQHTNCGRFISLKMRTKLNRLGGSKLRQLDAKANMFAAKDVRGH